MQNGYVVKCPTCAAEIDDVSLADEWFCLCGECGILQYNDDEEDE